MRTGKPTTYILLASFFCVLSATSPPPPSLPPPVPGRPSPEARALLDYLHTLSGRHILSGQHNFPGERTKHTARTRELTGREPALWGSDFGFAGSDNDKDAVHHRQAMIDEAIRQWRQGSLVTLMWHACRPLDDEPCGWEDSVMARLTHAQWRELITPGTRLHARWAAQVDTIAAYLQQLRAARVPVLWRPYHEMNGHWFWWGHKRGEHGYIALWRMLYDRLVNVHGLDNLIWVWNANAPNDDYAPYYPGHDYVDILATDIYGGQFEQRFHDELKALAGDKLVALGEVGAVPDAAVLEAQPHWVWFMIWAGYQDEENTPERLRALFDDPRTLDRDALPRPGG
jgi:mannan endo-1,4-beta-mannosidase